ncbi:synaptonemal complex protein 3-like [Littorina saxatilis]|uniref:XLR/SYCP3/FAM9 domain-containing protein n=1 Tax=Littorina saxatilis TaxID=31220 RepID=A0AAN9B4Q6_9CAEN
MPRQNKKNIREYPSSSPLQRKIAHAEVDKYSPKSDRSSPVPEDGGVGAVVAPRAGKKRQYEEEECGPSGDFSCEMQKMLDGFGADISKTFCDKNKRFEQFTQASLKTSAKKVEQIMRMQQTDRNKLQEEYCKQAESVLRQWETDIDKMKEQEEKLSNLFKQQQKVFQQTRVIQGQRLKTIRQLNEQFVRGVEELDKSHVIQQSSVQSELKKEMALLQKRILMDMQQREVTNMRKSLQTMLF